MITKEKILEIAKKEGRVSTAALSEQYPVSRQYLSRLLKELVEDEKLFKVGVTRSAYYVLPDDAIKHEADVPGRYKRSLKNVLLEEDQVFQQMGRSFPALTKLPENVRSVFSYAFSEMLNNAIEHSGSKRIDIEVTIKKKLLSFTVNDSGIGVFNNIMQSKKLGSVLEAIQELMKGKTTTMPDSHSGEGIFFTSKAGELFVVDSFGYQLIVNNELPDIFLKKTRTIKRGTRVSFQIHTTSQRRMYDLFKEYADLTQDSDHGFDKTKIHVKLYTIGDEYISRSQARRVLTGLEKFSIIEFDFDQVSIVGQAFADEIFRVFHNKHPYITLEAINMDEGAKFMVERVRKGSKENERS